MKILLKSITVLDATSDYHQENVDIFIDNGLILKIGKELDTKADKQLNGKGLLVSVGWLDLWSHFNDPGEEHKEDCHTGINAAMAGGYTAVALLPNTKPVVQNKSNIQYLKDKGRSYPVDLLPFCAVSSDCEGTALTEMIDARQAGAVAFTDGLEPIWHTDVFLKALIYMQKFDGLLINRPDERLLTKFGSMHEGKVSTTLGLRGMPSIAEVLIIERDLSLLRYAGTGKLHFATISSYQSVDLIRKAKKEGLDVTCSVAIWNLLYTDEAVEGYNTAFKLNPPLRKEEDREALIEGLLDHTIDAIVANHQAQDEECKKLEFDLADFGAISLQVMLPALLKLKASIPLEVLIEKISVKPRQILSLSPQSIREGEMANLTIFDPEKQWEFNEETNESKSSNCPLYGQTLVGKSLGVILGENYYFDPSLEK